jgi:transcriptional regulator with XRE-family HTH domain
VANQWQWPLTICPSEELCLFAGTLDRDSKTRQKSCAFNSIPYLRDQVPLREIARRLGISRNTVRRYLRSEITEPSYAERRASSALDKYSLQLSGWLKAETLKPRKQRRNLKHIHEDLKELGYEGSYDHVAAFARP